MTDGELAAAIVSTLDTGIATAPFNAEVWQAYNPGFSGPTINAAVLFSEISSLRFGFQGTSDVYNSGTGVFDTVDSWYLRTTFQINALMNQDVQDPNSYSASDVVGFCAGYLQSRAARATLFALNIGIDRITNLRTLYDPDDSERFNKNVNFDFVLTYEQTLLSTTPAAGVSVEIDRV